MWARVRSAIPLSRAFADHLGADALHALTDRKFKVVCPFHNDVNPSLHIDDATGHFHCFGCGASGSIIDFEKLVTGNRSLPTALHSLVRKYPVIASILGTNSFAASALADSDTHAAGGDHVHVVQPESPPRVLRRVRMMQVASARAVLQLATQLYQQALWHQATPRGFRYLTIDRRLSEQTLRAFGCGFAPPHSTSNFLLNALACREHPADHLVQAGLARLGNTVKEGQLPRHYDIFRNRIITPLRDLHGNTVSLAGRVLSGAEPRAAKYVNGPESVLFKKKNLLFGADLAKSAASAKADEGYVVVLEGYMDVMSLFDHTKGRVACVASMGAAMSSNQLKLAYDLLEDAADGRVIINFDNDDAGIKAMERLCDSVIPQMQAYCAHAFFMAVPPESVKDVDEFLNKVGKADQYVHYLLETALPWYQWRADRIIQEEMARLEKLDDIEVDIVNEPPMDEMVSSDDEDINFDFVLSDYLKAQCDDMLTAFGAPASDKATKTKKIPARCSPEVLERLTDVLVTAQECLPGLNVSALVHSWADSLARSQPSELLPLYRRLLAGAEKKSRPWRHLTAQSQLHWMPPAPWLLEELPAGKRKKINDAAGYKADGETMDLEKFMSDSRRVQRSIAKMKYQATELVPLLQQRQGDRVRRLRIAPRRSAEEIVLRTLIFASETDRVQGLERVITVMLRCEQNGLPFWTSAGREELFTSLSVELEKMSAEEMAAHVEEYEWFTPEIEELFLPFEEEEDDEWKAIRKLELDFPVKVVESTAMSVEAMAAKVASRTALEDTGRIMERMVAIQESEAASSTEEEAAEMEEFNQLVAKQLSLQKEVDGSKYWTPEELAENNEEMEEQKYEIWEAQRRKDVLIELRNGELRTPDYLLEEGEKNK